MEKSIPVETVQLYNRKEMQLLRLTECEDLLREATCTAENYLHNDLYEAFLLVAAARARASLVMEKLVIENPGLKLREE